MARIGGDDRDLPEGWDVDEDNWGKRLVRNGDLDRMKGKAFAGRGFVEDGFTYVMSAEAAAIVDGKK